MGHTLLNGLSSSAKWAIADLCLQFHLVGLHHLILKFIASFACKYNGIFFARNVSINSLCPL